MSVVATGSLSPSQVRYAVGERDSRPWGRWEVLATGPRYTLKRITVLPGQRLSLQYHRHRSEHWTIVQGLAEVEINHLPQRLMAGQHVHIPVGALHRIRALGGEDLVFVEVQVGAVLDENDIIRVDDDYGRVATPAGEQTTAARGKSS